MIETEIGNFKAHKVDDEDFRKSVIGLCNTLILKEHKIIFPGPMAVSIERANFETLRRNFYWVCEKSDGVRYILFVSMFQYGGKSHKMCFLINRSLEVFLVSMCFPIEVYRGTVMDGELVQKNDGSWSFLVFDCMCIGGEYIKDKCLSERLSHTREMLTYLDVGKSCLGVALKNFVPLQSFEEYVATMVPTGYQNDGFVFTPENTVLGPGRSDALFKLKPQSHHTVDFLVNNRGDACVWDNIKYKKITTLNLPPEMKKSMRSGGAIVECMWTGSKWVPVMIREDKNRPNNKLTLDKTLLNFMENIQLKELY